MDLVERYSLELELKGAGTGTERSWSWNWEEPARSPRAFENGLCLSSLPRGCPDARNWCFEGIRFY
jgi:hypothetical protein